MTRRRLVTVLPLLALLGAGVAVTLVYFPDVVLLLTAPRDPAAGVAQPDPHVRRAAARELARLGAARADAVPALDAALAREADADTRWLCAYALTRMGPTAGPALDKLAAGPRGDPAARLAASHRPFPTEAAELVPLLAHPSVAVREQARARIKSDARVAADAVPLLIAACRRAIDPTPPPGSQPPAFDPLNLPDTVPVVIQPPDGSFEPEAILAGLGAVAVPALSRAARDAAADRTPAGARFRATLYYIIARAGPPAPAAVPVLAAAVAGETEWVPREAAVFARRQIDPAAVPDLIREVEAIGARDKVIPVFDDLKRHGRAAEGAAPAVSRVLAAVDVRNYWLRHVAAQTLAAVGATEPAVAALTAALAAPEPSGAAEALARLGPVAWRAAPALATTAARPGLSPTTRIAVLRALDRVAPPDPGVLADQLDPAVRPDDGPAELLVARGPAAVPEVARVLANGPPGARQRAAAVLGRIRPVTAEAVAALAAALADPDDDRRAEAAWALGSMGREAAPAAPALLRAAHEAPTRDRAGSFRDAARLADPDAAAAGDADPGRAYRLAAVWAGLAPAAGAWVWFRRRAVRPASPVPVAAR